MKDKYTTANIALSFNSKHAVEILDTEELVLVCSGIVRIKAMSKFQSDTMPATKMLLAMTSTNQFNFYFHANS